MNYVDLFLALVIVLTTWAATRKGFILVSLELLCLLGSLLAALLLYPLTVNLIRGIIGSESIWISPLAFLGILVVTRFSLNHLADWLLRTTSIAAHESRLNKIAGLLPGTVSGGLYAMLISAIFLLIPISDNTMQEAQESAIATKLSVGIESMQAAFSPIINDLNRGLIPGNSIPSSDKFVKLPYTLKTGKRRPDLEAEMIKLVNQERRKQGLKALKADPQIAEVAIKHSEDMFSRGYFAHVSPEGKTPFDRIRQHNVPFLTAGENLALAQTLKQAHTGLMNSPGHRANILHKSFGRLGIGILDGGVYGIMVTQNFRN